MTPPPDSAHPVVGRQSSVCGPDRQPTTDSRRPEGVEGLWAALEEVMDPELPVSLVELGLIYDLRRAGATVEVDLTFTATACPCMGFIRMDIEERLLREPGVEAVRIHEVWNPPWTTARISARGRERLRRLGVAV